ncbi:MAG: transcription elongation factor GreA [Candidatus Spechtbacteria bacterium]|nr:transcription elongation factor GreA [Candidatus Spechtbacteria bacterium]
MMDYLTKEGLEQLRKELNELKTTKRAEIASRLKEAASFGDLSENAEYMEAKEDQAFLEGRIDELEEVLRNAQVVTKTTSGVELIEIGCAIEVIADEQKRTFVLVGKEQADPITNKISSESPLGKAMLGRRIGETVDIFTPSGSKQYKITKIMLA